MRIQGESITVQCHKCRSTNTIRSEGMDFKLYNQFENREYYKWKYYYGCKCGINIDIEYVVILSKDGKFINDDHRVSYGVMTRRFSQFTLK